WAPHIKAIVLDNGSNRLPDQTFDYALKLLRDSVTGKKHFLLDTRHHGVLLYTWLSNNVKILVDAPVVVSVTFDVFLKTWSCMNIFDIATLIASASKARREQLDDDDTAAVREKSLKKPSTAEPVLAEQQRQHLDQFVLMPINLSGTLWVCFVANGTSKKIHLYDSMDSTMYPKHSTTIGAENVAALPETYYKITV
ncbi:hypothetical protein GN958_ATG03581, partial [Phytophthora infestans]